MLTLSGATVLSQLVALLSAPVLTRMYNVHELGVFFVLNALGVAMATGFALRFELAIPLPSREDVARLLVLLACGATVACVVGSVILALVLRDQMSRHLGTTSSWVVVLVGPLAAAFALFSVFNAVAVREQRFVAIARRQIMVAVLTVGLQIIAGLAGGGVVALVAALLIAQLAGVVVLAARSPLLLARSAAKGVELGQVIRQYKRFPLLLAPAGWLNSFGTNAPLVLIGVLFASNAAGWFGLTMRIVAVPVALVGTSVAQVYLGELARRRREGLGGERALFYRSSKWLFGIALGFAIVVVLLGPWAFRFLFGAEWSTSGEMARVYVCAAAAQLAVSPMSQTLIVYERLLTQVCWDALRLVCTAGAVIVAHGLGAEPVTAVAAVACASTLCYAVNWELCRRAVAGRSTEWRATS